MIAAASASLPDREPPADSIAFSVVLPVFDEERGILATLDAVERALEGFPHPHEVVVVDDGSRDATPRLLATRTGIVLVQHAHNRGYGAALKSGIRAASHPVIVVMDADGTYPPPAVRELVERCATYDMVVGARIGRSVHATPARSTVKWFFRQFAQSITGAAIPDLNSGLRAFHRSVAERYLDLLPDGFSFTTTITVASLLEGLEVRFHAIDYMPRIGRSKLHPILDTLRIARQLVRLGVRFAPLRTSMWIVVPLLLGFVASSLWHAAASGSIVPADLLWLAAALGAALAGAYADGRRRRRRAVAAGARRGA